MREAPALDTLELERSLTADEALDAEPPILPTAWRVYGVRRALKALHGKHAPKKRKLSHGAKLAFLLITNYAQAFFSVPWLADVLEVEDSTARGYIAELEAAGVVWRHDNLNRIGGDSSNTYEVLLNADLSLRSRGAPARPRWHRVVDLSDCKEAASAGEGDQHEQANTEALRRAAASFETDSEGSESENETLKVQDTSATFEADGEEDRVPVVDEGPSPPYLELEAPEGEARTGFARPSNDNAAERRARRLERVPEKRDDGEVDRPHHQLLDGKRLALRDCRSPLLSSELSVALLNLPKGRAALRLLDQSGLDAAKAERAVRRVLQYDSVRGVSNAAGFITKVISDIREEGFDREERIEIHRHEPPKPKVTPERRKELDELLLRHPANQRQTKSKSMEQFLRFARS